MNSATIPPVTFSSLNVAGSSPDLDRGLKKSVELQVAPSPEFLFLLTLAGDAIIIFAAFCLALSRHSYVDLGTFLRQEIMGPFWRYTLFGTICYCAAIGFCGGYKRHTLFNQALVFPLLFKACWRGLAAFALVVLAFKLQPAVSRYFLLWVCLDIWTLLTAWRLLICHILHSTGWYKSLRERVVVVGWSKELRDLAERIHQEPGHPYEIMGCTPSAHGRFWVAPPRDVSILGDYNSLTEIIRHTEPNVVLLADLDPVMGEIIALANLCVREHVQFRIIPSYFQTFSSGLDLQYVSGVPVLGVSKLPLDHIWNRLIKRMIDVVGAIVGLVLSAPIILICGYFIHRESPGPIFYSQWRLGQNGRTFRMYKLRSMKLNADTMGAKFTTAGDPRRLKVGCVMRRWNLDEVPQFWNVLKGDMSLIGPRPEVLETTETLKDQIRHYNARHCAKPGLSGLAQVNGSRGDTDLAVRIRYDLQYLENWSLMLDLVILVKTFFARSNAY